MSNPMDLPQPSSVNPGGEGQPETLEAPNPDPFQNPGESTPYGEGEGGVSPRPVVTPYAPELSNPSAPLGPQGYVAQPVGYQQPPPQQVFRPVPRYQNVAVPISQRPRTPGPSRIELCTCNSELERYGRRRHCGKCTVCLGCCGTICSLGLACTGMSFGIIDCVNPDLGLVLSEETGKQFPVIESWPGWLAAGVCAMGAVVYGCKTHACDSVPDEQLRQQQDEERMMHLQQQVNMQPLPYQVYPNGF